MQHVCKQQIVEVESLRHFTNTSIYFTNTGITDFAVIDGSITTASNFILLYSLSLSLSLSLQSPFNGHFSRWTAVSRRQNVSIMDFIGSKDDGGGSNNWSYKICKAPVKSPPTNQHPVFLQPVLQLLLLLSCQHHHHH